jgi:hypothetical protein
VIGSEINIPLVTETDKLFIGFLDELGKVLKRAFKTRKQKNVNV